MYLILVKILLMTNCHSYAHKDMTNLLNTNHSVPISYNESSQSGCLQHIFFDISVIIKLQMENIYRLKTKKSLERNVCV